MVFTHIDIIILILAFFWSGIIRTGLGFGGTAFMLPIALLAVNSPLVIIPIIAVQLLLFSLLHIIQHNKNIDWRLILKLIVILLIPVGAGLAGLLTIPNKLLMLLVYLIIIFYAIYYIFPRIRVKVRTKLLDFLILWLGGYMIGLSLSGGVTVAAVVIKYFPKEKLRDSLFVLWALIAALKIIVFLSLGVAFHLKMQLWLLPAAIAGHFIGLKLHKYILVKQGRAFHVILGSALLLLSVLGLFKVFY
ncbi:MAG: TSUP family transporter [Pseudomonadota bacterium]